MTTRADVPRATSKADRERPASHLESATAAKPVGFGGGCHWCTEAVFQSLLGVDEVKQGWIRSAPPHEAWSEAVVVHFRPAEISLRTLVEIHLLTHSSTSDHSMRSKYRSAIYTFDPKQHERAETLLSALGEETGQNYVTEVLPFVAFRLNQEDLLDYYRTRPDAPFCQTYIHPKLSELRRRYARHVEPETLSVSDTSRLSK